MNPHAIADRFQVSLATDPPGVSDVPGLRNTRIGIHAGPPVMVACRRAGIHHRGTAVFGDIDIIPARTPSHWEFDSPDTYLMLSLDPELLGSVAEQLDVDPGRLEIRNSFQTRDLQLENIGWALKAEMEAGYSCGRVYFDSLGVSVAVRLVRCYSTLAVRPPNPNGRLPNRRLKDVLAYIEQNLAQSISLDEIASVSGFSVSHFQSLFRQSVGMPVHQYLIRRRVERARNLLHEGKLPISEIALESGFSHQSHLARHMRRVLGVSPKALRDSAR
jgi:AraC family transcriptional regulator